MTEEKKITQPQVEEGEGAFDDTKQKEVLIPVKFNKETKNLSVEEASVLAQKGMKYDAISEDYSALKELAATQNKSVSEFIKSIKDKNTEARLNELLEKCGGDREAAEHFLNLEMKAANKDDGFKEVESYFPEFKSKEDLPEEVLENARLKGSMLLDEYLRYLLKNNREQESQKKQNEIARTSSIGSQVNKSGSGDPELTEFLKGIWKK